MSSSDNNNHSKKRGREDDNDCAAPLSKRINNLHLTQNHHHQNVTTNGYLHQQQQQQPPHHNGHSSSNNANPNEDHLMDYEPYNPELTEQENPLYYRKNKLLYELHMERKGRQSWQSQIYLYTKNELKINLID